MSLDEFKTAGEMLEARRFRFKPGKEKEQEKKKVPRQYSRAILDFLTVERGATALAVAWHIQNRKVFTVGEMYTLLRKMVSDGLLVREAVSGKFLVKPVLGETIE